MTLAVVHARGSYRDLGRAQGEAFGAGIHAACAFYGGLSEAAGNDLEDLGKRGHEHLVAARARVPELVEELEGLVEGAGISLEEALALNCLEELWDLDACTTMVHGGFLLHAEQWYAGHSPIGIVVAEPDEGPAFASPTCVGFLPAVGMSAAGFAQSIDSLASTDDRVGIPRVLVSRLALGAPGLSAAIAAACTEGRAGGYAHVLVSEQRAVAVETSARRHALLEGVVAHTNHALSSQLEGVVAPPRPGSVARLERARRLLVHEPPNDLEDCMRVLSDHEGEPETICLHGRGPSAAGTVFALACDVASGRMIVSEGPPCGRRWEEISLPTSHSVHGVG